MLEDMVQIKIAVEGMKAQIVKVFDAAEISKAIKQATDKAVDEFDMENYIKRTVEGVFNQAREFAIEELSREYGGQWANDIERLVDRKIEQALKEQAQ